MWVHEKPILEVIFVTQIENSFAVTNVTKGSEICTPAEIAVGMHFHAQTWH